MKTALIVVDAINDFFHPDGSNYHPEYDQILEKVKEMLDLARQHKIMIVHTMESHIPGRHPDFEWRKLPQHNIAGTFAAQPAPGVEILPGEYSVLKRRYSAFFATDLDLILREAGVKRLLIVGVKTHVCVRATVQDAFGYGYDVIIVKDAVGSNHAHLHAASLEDIERYMGSLLPMEEAAQMMASAGSEASG